MVGAFIVDFIVIFETRYTVLALLIGFVLAFALGFHLNNEVFKTLMLYILESFLLRRTV